MGLTPLHPTCRVERELTKWEPEGPLANLSLDIPAGKGGKGGHWDQFEVNKRMFKVRGSSYLLHCIYVRQLRCSSGPLSGRML